MKRLTKLCPIATVLLTLGLSGCGSDSDNNTDNPPEKPPVAERNPAWEFIEVPYFDVKEKTKLMGEIEVSLGRRNSQSFGWIFTGIGMAMQGDMSYDLNGDGAINPHDVTLADMGDADMDAAGNPLPVFNVDTAKMEAYLLTNPDGLGAGTARPDVFVDGQYSVFDLLRYVVGTRDDLRFEGEITSYKDSQYDTYEFNLSWDVNGDGKFDKADGEYFNSPNWHFGFKNSPGTKNVPQQFYSYSSHGVAFNYKRMDQFWLREAQAIRFLPHRDLMTKRRHWVWQQEMERFKKNGGKFIISKITKTGDMNNLLFSGKTPEVIAENVEVVPFNLRSDVYQPGVITSMDVWLTLAKYHDMDFRFTFWPKTNTGAVVNSFGLSYTPWSGELPTMAGPTPTQGELAAANDFARVMLPNCGFASVVGMEQPDIPTCWEEYMNGASGNYLPEPIGTHHLAYPPEYMDLELHDFSYSHQVHDIDLNENPKVEMYVAEDQLQHTNLNSHGFDVYPTEDVTGVASLIYFSAADEDSKVGNAPILDETHFGWKIADCSQCHNEEKDPLGHGGQSWPVNKADGFDVIQPYYCASCHGNNGAPEGHNRAAGCFWCHNSNNGDGILPPNHGDVSKPKFIPAEKLVANYRTPLSSPVNRNGTIELFKGMWVASPNSVYNLSKTFPDPYACGTCHGYQKELKK